MLLKLLVALVLVLEGIEIQIWFLHEQETALGGYMASRVNDSVAGLSKLNSFGV